MADIETDSPCHPNNHRVVVRNPTDADCDSDLPVDQWILLVDPTNVCLQIPIISKDNRCFKVSTPLVLIGSNNSLVVIRKYNQFHTAPVIIIQ